MDNVDVMDGAVCRSRALRRLRMQLIRLAFIPVVFVAIFGWRSWADDSTTELIIESIGYVLLIAGVALRLWATLHIGGRKSIELVTDGPYSLCRNPLYAGTVLMAVGASLSLENLGLLAMAAVILIPLHAVAVVQEERKLAAIFGEQFREYCRQVPRFIFSFRNYRSPSTITVSTATLFKCAVNVSVLILIPVLEELVETLHASGTLPVLWRVF